MKQLRTVVVLIVIAVLPVLLSSVQSMRMLEAVRTSKTVVAFGTTKQDTRIYIFWSRLCAPCLREMPRIDSSASETKGAITFNYVSIDEYDHEKYSNKYRHIRFIYDKDSTLWKKYNPPAWGVAIAIGNDNGILWKGYAYQLTQQVVDSIMAGKKVVTSTPKYKMTLYVERSLELGVSEISYDPDASGLYVRMKNKPIGSLLRYIMRALYGPNTVLSSIAESNALASCDIELSVDCESTERKQVLKKVLAMIASGYGVEISYIDGRSGGPGQSIVIDYTNFTE